MISINCIIASEFVWLYVAFSSIHTCILALVESGIKLFSTAKQIFSRLREKGDFHRVGIFSWTKLILWKLSFGPQDRLKTFYFQSVVCQKENILPID